MNNVQRSALAAALAVMACASPSLAEVSVLQLYSTPDGEYQAILLEDDANDGVDRFSGLVFQMNNARTARTLVLTPDRVDDAAIVVDGRRRFLLATRQLSSRLRAQAELPDAFLAVEGGTFSMMSAGDAVSTVRTLALAPGLDWEPLPGQRIGWRNELLRHPPAIADRSPVPEANFFVTPPPAPLVREYYHAGRNRHLLTATQEEKSALDAGSPAGWERTGEYFRSIGASIANDAITVPVCRYYLPPPLGDTHFFSAFVEECEAVARRWPAAVLETSEAFRVALPERTTGLCLPVVTSDDPQRSLSTVPLYRAWNVGAEGSHRYTTSLAEQSERMLRGWVPEGYGPHGTAMCVEAYDMATIPVKKQNPKAPRPGDGR